MRESLILPPVVTGAVKFDTNGNNNLLCCRHDSILTQKQDTRDVEKFIKE